MITRISSLGAAIICAALTTAADAQTPTPSDGPMQAAVPALVQQQAEAGDPAVINKGKATYAERCSHCHGFGMINAGTVAPDLRKFPHDPARFISTVKLGKNNKMPPWGDLLSDDQIDSLWAYVSSQRKP